MKLQDAIQFIRHSDLSVPHASKWADLGCGSGTFTAAIAHFLQAGSIVYAADKQVSLDPHIPSPAGVEIKPVELDFVKDELPFKQLDGIVMANALHYAKDQSAIIDKIDKCLKPEGILVMVEYDTDKPVPTWVPYPLSYTSLKKLFAQHGYQQIEKINERSSVYGNANLYSALIRR